MAAITGKKSLIQEIVDSGGELIARGLSKAQFYQLTARYPEMLMEREKNGNITIMTPVKGGGGIRENKLNYRLNYYCEKHLGGQVFSPSTGFDLPNGATKSPDAAWLSPEKMARISPEKIEDSFIPEVPDFVAEILSKSDSLKKLQKKMENKTTTLEMVKSLKLIDMSAIAPETMPEIFSKLKD